MIIEDVFIGVASRFAGTAGITGCSGSSPPPSPGFSGSGFSGSSPPPSPGFSGFGFSGSSPPPSPGFSGFGFSGSSPPPSPGFSGSGFNVLAQAGSQILFHFLQL